MGDWTDFIQDIGGNWANSAIAARYQQPYEIQKMALQQYGTNGIPYTEGQANVQASAGNGAVSATIPQSWLILGAIIVAVMMMDD
jgi:hypothetical protein